MAIGAISVPAYTTNTVEDHRHVVADSGASGAVVSTRRLVERFLPAAHESDTLRFIVALEDPQVSQSLNVEIHRWDEILAHHTEGEDKEIEDTWRCYSHPIASRNLSNQVEDAVVDALVEAVKSSYPNLAHRYFGLKARWFGVRKLNYWDRNAPVPGQAERSYTWPEAKELVIGVKT